MFIPEYQKQGWVDGTDFFNPQLPGDLWERQQAAGLDPAKIEAEHLAEDAVICFPVTGETYSAGSLAEVGFSILNAIRLDERRDFIIMIDSKLDPKLVADNPVAAKESTRSRALVLAHLKKLRLANLYLVDNLNEMLSLSIVLFEMAKKVHPLRQKYNIPCSFP
jgi:hypothetical protein